MKYTHPMDFKHTRKQRRLFKPLTKRASLLESTKKRAANKGIINTLTIDDIIIPAKCPVFGIEITDDSYEESSPNVDRIDPSKGYTKENIRIISARANRIKNNATLEELEAIVNYLKTELQ